MSRSLPRRLFAPAALATITALIGYAANAQLGMYTLPKDDFTWNWGRSVDESKRRFEDFSVRGGEAGFNCELTGKARPGDCHRPIFGRSRKSFGRGSTSSMPPRAT